VNRFATLAAALVVAVGCAGSRDGPSAAALHHHYFRVGKRECASALKAAESQQGSGTLLGIGIAPIDTSHYPKMYRHDVVLGCHAAGG
jgi:hypothetical protein